MSFEIGRVVDHYRLERVIAQTATITVYEAFDLRLLRRVALKELAPGLSEDPAFRAGFARDAARAAQLDHPGIASVFDSNDHDGSLYFITKYVDGVTLRELAATRPISIGEAMVYLEQIAAALDYAHRRGVVHGSVGLAAVLVGSEDASPPSATLFDVGIGKRRLTDDETPAWFPPAGGEWSPKGPAADLESRRVDLVGLARLAFELLTRRAPQDALASASMLDPALPPAVDEVFAAVLDDADRDMTCTGFVAALRRALPAALLVRTADDRGEQLPPPRPPAPERAVPAEGGAHRRLLLVVASLVAVVLVGAVLLWQGTRPTEAGGRVGVPPATAVSQSGVAPGLATSSTAARPTTSTSASTSTSSSTTMPATSTTMPATSTTVAPTDPPTEPPTSPAPALNQFGDVVGQPVTQPASPEGLAAVALQQRRPPEEVAQVDTPAAYYAEWLRLTTAMPTGPVLATGDGYAIDAGTPAEINQFQVDDSNKVVSFVECVGGMCTSVTGGVRLTDTCEPGPGCNAFATDDGTIIAVLRATVTLRNPAITLIFSVTSSNLPIVAVNDPYNTVRFDGDTGSLSVTLAAAPPPGTQSSLTFTYVDGTSTSMAITYG